MADPLDSSDKYSNIRRIAVGGMGEVLIATYQGDHGLGISEGRLVLKRTLPRHPNRVHQNEMLLEEGRIGLRLLHQNLVETFAVDRSGDDPLLLMEFLGGKSIAQVLGVAKKTKTPLGVELALKICRDVACGLHFAHTLTEDGRGLGLVHRDVSPANIFATYDGRVKVIDFGVAKAKDSEIRTSTGILKGKIGYMSPEHAAGETLTPATDLWSIGVVLWEMLIADRLFSGTTPAVTLYQITHGEIERPQSRRPEIPNAVDALVMRLLSRDRQSRIPSGAQLVKEIDALGYDLNGVDVGAFLRSSFPDDSAKADRDVREAATRHGRPAPYGLIDGEKDVAETIVRDSGDLMRLAREISGDPSAAATMVEDDIDLEGPPSSPPNLDDAPTRAMAAIDFSLDPRAIRSDEGEAATLVDDGRIRSLLEQAERANSERATEEGAPVSADVALFGNDDAKDGAAPLGSPHAGPPASDDVPSPDQPTALVDSAMVEGAMVEGAVKSAGVAPAMQVSLPASAPTPAPEVSNPTPFASATPDATPAATATGDGDAPPKDSLEGPTPGPREAVPMRGRSVGTVAVALASFGAIALVLGVIFSFVAHRRAAGRTPVVYVYPGDAGTDVIVARVADAPAAKRKQLGAINLSAPIARVAKDGPRQKRDPAAFMTLVTDTGVLERARLPTGGRKTAAALPPAIVLLSLFALALSLPSFLSAGGIVTWGLRLVLMVVCVIVGVVGTINGVLSWPGTSAYKEIGPPPQVDAADLLKVKQP